MAKSQSSSFETRLIAYQKIAVLIMVPALLSAFWAVASIFGAPFSAGLTLAGARLFAHYVAFQHSALVYSLVLLALSVLLALRAARGTLAFYLVGFGLYVADLIVEIVLLCLPEMALGSIVSIIIHAILIGGYAFGFAMYKSAEKKLQEEKRRSK